MRGGRRLLMGIAATICALTGAGGASATATLSSSSTSPSPSPSPSPAPTPADGCQSASFVTVAFELPAGARIVSERDLPVCLTGSATISFHGSRAAGCRPHGLCAYAGTDTWRPKQGTLTVVVISVHGRRRTLQMFTPGSGPLGGVVKRRSGGRVVGTCRDSGTPRFGLSTTLEPVRYGRAAVQLPRGGVDMWPSLCAGPLAAGLPRLHSIGLSVAKALRGTAAAAVDRSRPFSRGGFAGTATEHLTLTTGLSAPRGADRPPAIRRRRHRFVTATYRLRWPIGAVAVDWAHAATGCTELDACGLHGRENLRLDEPAAGSTLQIAAEAPVSRPKRDLLTALGLSHRGDAKGIDVFGEVRPRTEVSTTSRQRGVLCHDGRSVGPTAILISGSGGRLEASYESLFEGDPLRSSCPGPALGLHALASATFARGALASHRFTLSLTRPTTYDDHGYVVHLAPQLNLVLTREHVTQRVREFVVARRAAATARGATTDTGSRALATR